MKNENYYIIICTMDGYYGYKGARKERHKMSNFSKEKSEFKLFTSEESAKKTMQCILKDFNIALEKSSSKNKGVAYYTFEQSLDVYRNTWRIDAYLECRKCTRCSSSCEIRKVKCS